MTSRRLFAAIAIVAAIAITSTTVAMAASSSPAPGITCTGATPDADGTFTLTCQHVGAMPTAGGPTATPSASQSPTAKPTDISQSPTTPASTSTAPGAQLGWPDATNTGVPPGTTLTPWTESCDLRTPNQVIENRIFNCQLTIYAANVTIRKSLVRGGADWGASTRSGGQATFENVTFESSKTCNGGSALTGSNYTARRVKALNFGEGFWVSGGGNVNVSDSYAKVCALAGSGAHSDGIQAYQATGASTFRHNQIDQRGAAACCVTAVLFWSDSAADSRVTFVDNLVRGGGYTLRIHSGSGHVVTGNVVERGSWNYGPVLVDCARVATWADNRTAVVGADLTLSSPAALSC